jgi:hypothetical protein
MRDVGRNDPCPCGSGRKYKRCCLGAEAGRVAALPFTPAERERALGALQAFVERREFDEEHALAEDEYWGDDLEDDELDEAMQLEASQAGYDLWFAADRPVDDDSGQTPVELFLEREGGGLGTGEREYLVRLRASHVRLYEVVEVRPEEGLRLDDLWTGERLWVPERLGTRQVVRWDLLAGRLLRGAQGDWALEGMPFLLPAGEREAALAELRKLHDGFAAELPEADLAGFFKYAAAFFHQLWLDLVALRPPPTVLTAEGDPFVLARVVFDVRDHAKVAAAMAGHPDLDAQNDGRHGWHEAGDPDAPGDSGPRRWLGTFVLETDRVVFETTSEPRAARGRGFLEGLVGAAVRFRETVLQDPGEAVASLPDDDPEPAGPDVPPEVQAAAVAEFLDGHYRRWPDMPLPALDGQTPRAAAGLDAARPQVVALLKDMESRAARERQQGRVAYDFTWLWAELSLERPE